MRTSQVGSVLNPINDCGPGIHCAAGDDVVRGGTAFAAGSELEDGDDDDSGERAVGADMIGRSSGTLPRFDMGLVGSLIVSSTMRERRLVLP